MKGCAIAVIVVLCVLMVLITAAAVFFFAFEKDVPESLISYIQEGIKGLGDTTFDVNYDLVNEFGDIAETTTRVTYDSQDNIFQYQKIEMVRQGKDGTLVLEAKLFDKDGNQVTYTKLFIEDGKYKYTLNETTTEETETTWKNYVVSVFIYCMPFETKDSKYKLIGSEYLEKLSRMTQKGMSITAYAYNGDDEYVMTFNLKSSMLNSYKITTYQKEGSTVISKTVKEYVVDLDLSKFAK